jgi:hypothetical protein
MQGFMPGGYETEGPQHRWYTGVAWGVVFVFLILWLNFDDNVRIFALSTYVWYWMAFIMPDHTAGFAQNFQIKLNGKAIKELLVAAAGCGIAIIAAYFPYPIYAHAKALNLCRSMMDQIFMAKTDFLQYYGKSDAADRLKVRVLAREMDTLRSEASSVGDLLGSAWYECLGMGTAQKQRVMMDKFQGYITQTIDLLSMAFTVGLDESFDSNHQNMMNNVEKELSAVVSSNGQVLLTCIAFLNLGEAPDELIQYGSDNVKEAKASVEKLTKEFRNQRVSLGMNEVNEDNAGENVVCLTFCQFTELTEKFFNSLQEEQIEKKTDKSGILGVFAKSELMDKDHIMWTLRNGLSILLAFWVGWHGYNQYISMYNASLAGTVAVLLSKFAGSAMTKNLSRLQGVVIGIVLGNLLYALLGWCYWWGHLLVALALYFWTLMGLFMYFHSENYGTVGLLLVVFGAQALLRPCANSDTDPSGHSLIVNVTVAICIMTIVDLLLSQARASDLAVTAFKEAAVPLRKAMDTLLDKDVTEVPERKGALAGKIASAKAMGSEAAQEPRYWRLDWPTSTFDQGIACLYALRFNVNAIEHAVLKAGKEEGMRNKTDAFQMALKLKSFSGEGGLRELLDKHYEAIMKALEDSLGDHASHDVFVNRLGEVDNLDARETAGHWQASFDLFCKELNAEYKKGFASKQVLTLHDDALAEMSVFVEALKCMFVELDKVLDAVVA